MTARRVLPNRRRHHVFDFVDGNINYTAGAGFFEDGGLAELFLSCAKPGCAAETAARDAAVICSIALQHGAPLSVIRTAVARLADGSAAGPIARALDIIEASAYAP